jgi:protein SCO1/2
MFESPPFRPRGRMAPLLVALTLVACDGTGAVQPRPEAERSAQAWGAGYFPDVQLTTHTGREVRFFSDLLDGRVVAVNFIYTSCPDACPMETARMRDVQRILGDRLGEDVFFYSISIDPAHDTPEVLAAYVAKWGIGPGWTFLTGAQADIDHLRKKLGVYTPLRERGTSQDHNLSLILGNARTGRWMKRSPYENPYVLATQLGSWLHNWKRPPDVRRPYADAPKVRPIGAGEDLFRTRCSSCHAVGGAPDGATPLGPDLYNITRHRDRAWLERWIRSPDAMVAARDPLALSLVAQSGGIQMPNLRLTAIDVQNVLGYLEAESARVDASLPSLDTPLPDAHDASEHHGTHDAPAAHGAP